MRISDPQVVELIDIRLSLAKLSTLLTARTTGLWERRSISATLASASCMPCRTSVMKMITSAVSMAICACSRICDRMMSLLSGSIPPVSIRVKLRSSHSHPRRCGRASRPAYPYD